MDFRREELFERRRRGVVEGLDIALLSADFDVNCFEDKLRRLLDV